MNAWLVRDPKRLGPNNWRKHSLGCCRPLCQEPATYRGGYEYMRGGKRISPVLMFCQRHAEVFARSQRLHVPCPEGA